MTVCFFFDRINYMNSKKRHGRFNTFYGRFMTVCRLPRLLTQQGLTTIERVNNAG